MNLSEILGSLKRYKKGKKVMEHHQTVARPHNDTPGCWATVKQLILILWEKLFISKYTKKSPKNLQNGPKQRYVGWAERFLIAWNVNEIFAFKT